MEYLNVLHRLFNEDKGWLTTHYLSTTSYLNFLTQEFTEFYTHFSVTLPKEQHRLPATLEYDEIPFYTYQAQNPKKGYTNIAIDHKLPQRYKAAIKRAEFHKKDVERIHYKEGEHHRCFDIFNRFS